MLPAVLTRMPPPIRSAGPQGVLDGEEVANSKTIVLITDGKPTDREQALAAADAAKVRLRRRPGGPCLAACWPSGGRHPALLLDGMR